MYICAPYIIDASPLAEFRQSATPKNTATYQMVSALASAASISFLQT